MKLNKMPKEELELFSYEELTQKILEEEKKPLNTPTIFRKICDLLEMSDDDYANKIGDYYTALTTDKNFVLLQDGTWDLRDHHPVSVVLDDEDEIEEEEEETLEEDLEEEGIIEDDLSDDDADEDELDLDELDDDELTIIDEEELEN